MLESFLTWLAWVILNYLLGKASKSIMDAKSQMDIDKANGVINDANSLAYEKAQSRADRVKASIDLLNGNTP